MCTVMYLFCCRNFGVVVPRWPGCDSWDWRWSN